MKIFDYQGLRISTDSSCVDNVILEKPPYAFHLSNGVVYIMKNLDRTLSALFDQPVKEIKIKKKKEIKRLIDENYGELIIKTNVGEINDNLADILELP